MEDTDQRKKESVSSLVAHDEPLSMSSWGEEVTQDYGNVYQRKSSEYKDQQAAMWESMYEKNLGRKVSELPPWVDPKKDQSRQGDPTKTDLVHVHMARAKESGVIVPTIKTAEQQRHHRRRRSKRSGSSDGSVSSVGDEDIARHETKNGTIVKVEETCESCVVCEDH